MFRVQFTPLHPEGYPKVGSSYKNKDPHAPFFQRHSVGGPYCKYATRDEARAAAQAFYDLMGGVQNGSSRYDLRADVVEVSCGIQQR